MLSSIFTPVTDPRVQGRTLYKLSDLLTCALLTLLSNGVDFADMEEFAKHRAKSFGLFEDCESTPSHDTFRRMLGLVEPDEMMQCLCESGMKFLGTLAEKQVIIDGKKLRGYSPRSQGTNGKYLLNAYVSENHFVVGQQELQDKENEIVAIPQLLDKINLEGAIVTIDAIGTQVNIAQKIINLMAHYLLAVKENQKALYEEVTDAFKLNNPISEATEMNEDHGRLEERTCRILPAEVIEDKDITCRWANLTTIVEITSDVTIKATGETTRTKRYYISDEDFPKASYFNMLARAHWEIENQLHWQLDVNFLEDDCRARTMNAAQNLSIVRKLALQIAKDYKDSMTSKTKPSIRKLLFRASLNSDFLLGMFANYKF